MVHGRLPGTSWLGRLSVKEKERGEIETPLPVGRAFCGNCLLRGDSVCDYVQPVQVTLAEAAAECSAADGRAALDWEWWWVGGSWKRAGL